MNVLGIGPAELILVFVLALVFIGPGRMPDAAASVGKAMREFQKASAELSDALNAEVVAAQAAKASAEQPNRLGDAIVVEPSADLDASSSEAPLALSPVIDPMSAAPWEAVGDEPNVAIGTGWQTMVEPPLISAPINDPTGMSPLPASLTAPSESMRVMTLATHRHSPVGNGAVDPSLAWSAAASVSPIDFPSAGAVHTVATAVAVFAPVGCSAETASPTEA